MMGKAAVWPAMLHAYEGGSGDLADRLIAALEAAEARRRRPARPSVGGASHRQGRGHRPALGRRRSRCSTCGSRITRRRSPSSSGWCGYQRAYAHANRGDELMTDKKVDDALREYRAASQLAPEVLELPFWHAVTLASIGREAEAAPIFTAVFAKEPQWVELLGRLPAAGLFPDDAALIGRIRALARPPGGGN